MMGRYVLPWFGGGPAVWTNCLLFFQALLLAGYAYAHWLGSRPSTASAGLRCTWRCWRRRSRFCRSAPRCRLLEAGIERRPFGAHSAAAGRDRGRALPAACRPPGRCCSAGSRSASRGNRPGGYTRCRTWDRFWRCSAIRLRSSLTCGCACRRGSGRGCTSCSRGCADGRHGGCAGGAARRGRRTGPADGRRSGRCCSGWGSRVRIRVAAGHHQPDFPGDCGESVPVGGAAFHLPADLHPDV